MPESTFLAMIRQSNCIDITVTNNDSTAYTGATVFVDIPSQQIQALGCPFSQMRLEDSNGNPITFWPDAGGASEIYPGYYTIWFKVDLPASGTVNLRLYCNPNSPTYTSTATDVVDMYFDLSDSSQLYQMSQYSTFDTSLYVDPPASLWQMKSSDQLTNVTAANEVEVQYYDKFIVKLNWLMKAAGSGHIPAMRNIVNGTENWAGPYVWFGSTSPWAGYGTNIGYYVSSYSVLGTYSADGQWHRVLLLVRAASGNFDLWYDNNQLGTNLGFISGYNQLQAGVQTFIYFTEIAHDTADTSDNHIDSIVFTSVPYDTLPTTSTSLSLIRDTSCIQRPLSTF